MLKKLEFIAEKYKELSIRVSDPDVIADQATWQNLMREMSEMEPIARKYNEYMDITSQIDGVKEILADSDAGEEMHLIAKDELSDLQERLEGVDSELRILMLPKDSRDEKDVILEIRAGTGGEEAALFGADLLRMYTRYAERNRWECELIDINDTGIGGIKEAIISIKGRGVFSRLKYESGVHRVQRVPETESSGRVHTSAATVAVLPQADEVEISIDPADVRVDTYRSSGHGGQSVNTTDSAIRLTHIPTGMVVTCQDEKSQIKNKDKAFAVLRARLYDLQLQQQQEELSEERRSQVGSGDRSERIRTYNFPQGRVSDHRTGETLYKLTAFLDGDIDEIVDGLASREQAEKLKNF